MIGGVVIIMGAIITTPPIIQAGSLTIQRDTNLY